MAFFRRIGKATSVIFLEWPFPQIDPVAIRIGPVAIRWYALMYLIAFAIGYVLMRYRLRFEPYRSVSKPKPWASGEIIDVLVEIMLGVLIGGRLGFVLFYQPGYFFANPLHIFYVWDGGMSFHGGLIGVMAFLWWYGRRTGRPFFQITDLIVTAAPIGLAVGRLGNFINGELWGRVAPEWLPWAMRFPTGGDVLRHPSQLYQVCLEGLTLFALVWLYARKPHFRGQVSGFFLFGYGVFRFIAEYFRAPDSYLGLLSLGLSMGQWLSVPMIIGGAALWWWSRQQAIWDPESQKGGDSADDDGLDEANEDDADEPSASKKESDDIDNPDNADNPDDEDDSQPQDSDTANGNKEPDAPAADEQSASEEPTEHHNDESASKD